MRLRPSLEANVQGVLALADPPDAGSQGGVGDTVVGVKHRVLDETPASPALLGRATLRLPTGDEARSLGADRVDVGLLLVVVLAGSAE